MVRKCKKCGKEFTPNSPSRYLCDECLEKKNITNIFREKTCQICGRKIDGYIATKYCPECSREKRNERQKTYRQKGFTRHIGDVDRCARCGAEYMVQSGAQKYCKLCAKLVEKENDHRQAVEYYHNRGGKEKSIENAKKIKENTTVCPVCGKLFTALKKNPVYCSRECAEVAKNSEIKYFKGAGKPRMTPAATSKTGKSGVSWSKTNRKYVARITIDGVRRWLGSFDKLEDAVKVRREAEEKYLRGEQS